LCSHDVRGHIQRKRCTSLSHDQQQAGCDLSARAVIQLLAVSRSLNQSVSQPAVMLWRSGHKLRAGPRLLKVQRQASMCTGQMATSSALSYLAIRLAPGCATGTLPPVMPCALCQLIAHHRSGSHLRSASLMTNWTSPHRLGRASMAVSSCLVPTLLVPSMSSSWWTPPMRRPCVAFAGRLKCSSKRGRREVCWGRCYPTWWVCTMTRRCARKHR
jgi:hypothetical protein